MNVATNVATIREQFLRFFASKGHTVVPSSPLVPGNDPTLLFTNSGMVQFKDVFTGKEPRPYTRATSSQRSVRAGGKHNDLENVGYTARHHTFFEMLGNFSFGDYFKRDAIAYAWELLTTVYQLPAEKLWVTVYHEDDEAYAIWHEEVGVPAERIVRIGDNKGARYASDNFWQMADTGPCGPCTEIFYDHGPDVAGGPPGSAEEDGDRYIEIWNLVFMQYDRSADGVLHPLPKPCVDTGMGLERIAAVLQHVHSNYEIDLFQALIHAAAREVAAQGNAVETTNNSLKVIADHLRACSFLITDGVIPSNEGRGYVLRRIVRRAIRHGYKLGCRTPFLHALVPTLVAQMGTAYPELATAAGQVQGVLQAEEQRFFETIEHGMGILETALQGATVLDGATAFKLHDTFGFPLDLTADVCRERGVAVDEAGFEAAMAQQKQQARAAGKFKMAAGFAYSGVPTDFKGYGQLRVADAMVTAIYVDGTAVDCINAHQQGVIVLSQTPFYAESGGQVGDRGTLWVHGSPDPSFCVEDTQKIQPYVFGHFGEVAKGSIKVGDRVHADVDEELRAATARNHSATHLLHKALRDVLGTHVAQKGSLVDADKTRFDFAHPSAISPEQLAEIERCVNAEIVANHPTQAQEMALDAAKATGAMMLFGEKYSDTVRVLSIGNSCELCGGTHVARTGDIGLFKITLETGVAAGVRRIEATTGLALLAWLQNQQAQLEAIAQTLRVPVAEALTKTLQQQEATKAQDKELERLKSKLAAAQGQDLAAQATRVQGVAVLAAQLEGADPKQLRETADQLRNKLGEAALVLATVQGGKISLIAAVSSTVCERIKAGDLVGFVAQQVGGKGGGKADMAQAGGTQPEHLAQALASVQGWVAQKLGG